MKHAEFIDQLDDARITAAIAAAEKQTSGQIRVFISRRACPDPLAAAEKHFRALHMDKTRSRNAVLILIAPRSRTFAIFGDTAVHERCGEAFWTALRDEMQIHLKESRYTDALVHAIARAGQLLAAHFPPRATNAAPPGDDLPNNIARD